MKPKLTIPISLLFFIALFSLNLKAQTNKKQKFSKAFSEQFTKKLNDSIPSIGSFIVSQNGKLIYEHYFNGATKDSAFDIKSVTKSVTSILAGIAKDKALLSDLETPVLKILPEYNTSRAQFKNTYDIEGKSQHDSIRNMLTLKHLLTMRGGFDYTENSKLSRAMGYSSDPVKFMFDLPFEEYPGDKFNYSTGETNIFGAALSKMTHLSLEEFAKEHLFLPLNITIETWFTDTQNRNLAGSELLIKPNDMLKIGNLVLNKGKYENKQIVSEKWIEESTSEQVKLDFWDVLPDANGYGYYWWRRKTNGHQVFAAIGYGGQMICVIPDLKMVIVATCFLNEKNRGRIELKKLHSFIDEITK